MSDRNQSSFQGSPLLTLKRTKILRIAAAITLGPMSILCALVAVACAQEKVPLVVAIVVFSIASLSAAGTLLWLLPREASLELRLYEDGIEERSSRGLKSLRWSAVREVWIRAVSAQVGGMIGAVAVAAADAARRDPRPGLNESSTNIVVRIVGADGEIALTSNYKGVVSAMDEVLRRVNPTLVAEAMKRVKRGESVSFGKFSLSTRGVAFGRKEPVPFAEIEKLNVESGKLYLKKRGSWLSTGGILAEKVPNLYVLTELFDQLSGGAARADTSPDQGLSRRTSV